MSLEQNIKGISVKVELSAENKVTQINLSHSTKSKASSLDIFRQIENQLNGGSFDIDWQQLDTHHLSAFQKKVYQALMTIPCGKIITYKQLAAKCGSPKASRAVGTAMAKNPFPLLIPCHRVVRSGGAIGQYAFGTDLKRKLLRLENAL